MTDPSNRSVKHPVQRLRRVAFGVFAGTVLTLLYLFVISRGRILP